MIALILAAALAVPPQLPDPKLTPGAVNPAVTVAMVCAKGGYTNKPGVRHVTPATKRAVLAEYGYTAAWGPVEVDHRIPLIIGGANSIDNLWSESYVTQPFNAHVKDHLEVGTWRRLCHGEITLQRAQAIFLGDMTGALNEQLAKDAAP